MLLISCRELQRLNIKSMSADQSTQRKISKYIVTEHYGDRVYIWSTRSGAVVDLTKSEWDDLVQEPSKSTFSSRFLREKNILVDDNEDELKSLLNSNILSSNTDDAFDLVVVPSSNCPLGCNIPKFGSYCGQVHTKNKIPADVSDAIAKFVQRSLRSYHRSLRVNWFGGEPLLALDRIKLITARLKAVCEAANVAYVASIVTGGTLLTKEIARACFHELGVKAISVTLDGLPHDHDLRRCTKGGKPTFDIIFRNIEQILEDSELRGITISVRCNVDNRNTNAPNELIELFHKTGLQEKIDFYAVPIHPWGQNDNSEIVIDSNSFATQEILWFSRMKMLGFKVSLLPTRKPIVCRVVSSSKAVVDYDGSISRCTESPLTATNKKNDIVGHVRDNQTLDELPTWSWHDDVAQARYPCATCEYYPVCGGACPLSWKSGTDIPCPSFKLNGKARLRLFAEWDQLEKASLTKSRSPFALANIALAIAGNDDERSEIRQIDQDLSHFRSFRSGLHPFEEWENKNTLRRLPWRIRVLMSAAIASTGAYLAYREGSASLLFLRTEAALLGLQKLDDDLSIDTRPARLEIVLNYTRACVRNGWRLHSSLGTAIDHYFAGGTALSFGNARIRKLGPTDGDEIFSQIRRSFNGTVMSAIECI